jgi:DNA modification methylase
MAGDTVIEQVDDSFEAIKQLPPDSFDHTITDPPYTKKVHANMRSGSKPGTKSVPSAVPAYDGLGGSARTVDYDPLADYDWIGDLLRVSRRWVISFCAIESLGLIEARFPNEYVRGAVWLKPNSMGQLTGDRPATAYEAIAILHRRGKKYWNGRGSYGVWKCSGTRGEVDRHPQQKPLNLCLALVSLFTDVGESILDPFAGSARIGEAATLLDRDYVGFERDPEWTEKGRARLALARKAAPVDDEIARGLCRAFARDQ